MPTNYIALAVPFFFLFIGVEVIAARVLGRRVYRFHDSVTNLGCGVASQLCVVFFHAALIAGYVALYERHRLASLPASSPWTWLLAFLAVDFIYYWWHRLSHEVNFLWAAHVVHHSSEDYNLAVALRQAVATSFTGVPFYLPLALVGVPPVVYVTIHSFNTLYQFWIHTQLIGRLGPVEYLLNTPSQHRVHHAINPRYLDKNYGGTLSVWDRLFGTFEAETEAPVYGIVKPLESFNPFIAQFHYWFEMGRTALTAPRRADRIRVLWKSPAWHAEGLAGHPLPHGITPDRFRKYDPPVGRAGILYVSVQFAVALAATFVVLMNASRLPPSQLGFAGLFIVLTLFSVGAIFEGRRWAGPLEAARLALVVGAAAVHFYP